MNNMNTYRTIAVILIVAAAGGCGEHPDGADYFPISETAVWEYDLRIPELLALAPEMSLVVRGDGSQDIDGMNYVRQVEAMEGMPGAGVPPTTRYVRVGSDGVYVRGGFGVDAGSSNDPADAPEFLLLPFPLEVGRSWNWEHEGEVIARNRIEAIETLRTSRRTFEDALKVIIENKEDEDAVIEMWYVQKLGMVRMVIREGGEIGGEATLREFGE